MKQSPRERRLRSDYEKVKRLVRDSGGSLRLVDVYGNPPRRYVIEYHCNGLVKKKDGRMMLRLRHQVDIGLDSDYPMSKPAARMLTPIFNPHIYTSNDICLGVVWSPSETLDTLILRIGALIQLDPQVLNAGSPANVYANDWVAKNRHKIPLGTVSFKAAEVGAQSEDKRVNWA